MQEYVAGRNGVSSESRPSGSRACFNSCCVGPLACLSEAAFTVLLPALALGACFSDVLAECLLGEERRPLGLDWVAGGAGLPLLEPKVPGV